MAHVPRTRALAIAVVAVAAAAALVVFGLAGHTTSRKPAPALPTQVLAGRRIDLTQLRGRPAFIVFWASWCPPCQGEAPAIERFARSVSGRANVVGVDWSDPEASAARAFIRRYGWTFTSLRDGSGDVGFNYDVTNLPTTFVLDSGGRIAAKLIGGQTVTTLDRALKSL